jgi:uncharacterized membrane protein YcaP (DUF421 family)
MAHALWYIPWHDLFLPGPSWAEKVLRPILVYVVLLVIFRLASKRELAQATLFDFLIILLISNVVQNAMIGADNSILGAVAGALVLVLLSGLLNRLTANNKRRRVFLEGKPSLLIRKGALIEEAMRHNAVSRNDLFMAIRKQGLCRLSQVGYAILELDGSISIIPWNDIAGPCDCLPPEVVGADSREECAG